MPFDVIDIFNWFSNSIHHEPALYIYGLIVLLMTIESSFIPFPSEIVVPPAAYFAMQTDNINIIMVVICATIGALLGAWINYGLSIGIGRPIVYKFANSRLGAICLINQQKVEDAERFFDKHGVTSTFIGRLIPAVRQLISIPAGLARMNFFKFSIYTFLGAGVWNIVLAWLGYFLSTFVSEKDLFVSIEKYNSYLSMVGYGILAIIIVFIAYQLLKKKK